MTPRTPRVTLGLPVYDGERYLAQALDSLLAQTFTDFELLVSDNASTDATPRIVAAYAARDPRIRVLRQPHNRGSSFNHNLVVREARGEYFKWVAHDDLYAPDLLERCVAALDADPGVVVAHAWTATLDELGRLVERVPYRLATAAPSAAERFRSLLHTDGGDDIYGVIPLRVLRRIAPFGSHHLADRTFVAELALHGRFANVPEHLYYRRHHPGQVTATGAVSVRSRCARWDPRRADRWRHPAVRLVGEYLLAYVVAIHRAPIGAAERRQCYRDLAGWALRHGDRLRPAELRRILGAGTAA
jgi:glycosyltransferase involved in cell wall biosynthesis